MRYVRATPAEQFLADSAARLRPDQRLCIVPDGDLFKSIKKGRASVVTDTIETFTERGVRLASGQELEADIIVAATGLNLLPLAGLEMVSWGAGPGLGQLESGAVAGLWNVRGAIVSGGFLCVAGSAAIPAALPSLWRYEAPTAATPAGPPT